MSTRNTQRLYEKAVHLIPGGTQLLSKRPERYCADAWPAYFERAKGCRVWDLDQREYIDMGLMGIGSCLLGYADEDVNAAVRDVIEKGTMCTLNCPEEVELAEKLCELHPWAEHVRFARTGGEALAIAIRIARAKTSKDFVMVCGYHGWHDWYLASNLIGKGSSKGFLLKGLDPIGVPRALEGTTQVFFYNDTESFLNAYNDRRDRVAAVIMEPIRSEPPAERFLSLVRELTAKDDVALIFDEVTSGWRFCLGGAHLVLGIQPDIAVFAKAMSNGFPMSAIIGRKDFMEVARTAFISSTYWTERIGPVAALATIRKMKDVDLPSALHEKGEKILRIWMEASEESGIPIDISAVPEMARFSFQCESEDLKEALRKMFIRLMLEKRFLAPPLFYPSLAHDDEIFSQYEKACKETFQEIKTEIDGGFSSKQQEELPDFFRLVR